MCFQHKSSHCAKCIFIENRKISKTRSLLLSKNTNLVEIYFARSDNAMKNVYSVYYLFVDNRQEQKK